MIAKKNKKALVEKALYSLLFLILYKRNLNRSTGRGCRFTAFGSYPSRELKNTK
jgi:hypothetical protein